MVRTFSKAYGLAALRVGYALAAAPVATALQRVAAPFAVNGMAIVGALASLSATAELDDRVSMVVAESERLTRQSTTTSAIVPPFARQLRVRVHPRRVRPAWSPRSSDEAP